MSNTMAGRGRAGGAVCRASKRCSGWRVRSCMQRLRRVHMQCPPPVGQAGKTNPPCVPMCVPWRCQGKAWVCAGGTGMWKNVAPSYRTPPKCTHYWRLQVHQCPPKAAPLHHQSCAVPLSRGGREPTTGEANPCRDWAPPHHKQPPQRITSAFSSIHPPCQ